MPHFSSLILLLLTSLTLSAQDAYVLKLNPPGKGDRTESEFTSRVRMAAKKGGQEFFSVKSHQFSCSDRILEGKGKEAAQFVRHFVKARATLDGEPVTFPFEGQTWVITSEGGATSFRTEKGEPVPEKDAEAMKQAFQTLNECRTRYDELLPGKAVKVGDTWPIDAASWVKRPDAELVVTRAEGKLVKVSRQGGRLHGVLEFRVEVALKSMTVAGRKLPLQPGGKLVMKNVLEGCIDGTSPFRNEESSFTLSGVLVSAGPDGVESTMDQLIEITARFACRETELSGQ